MKPMPLREIGLVVVGVLIGFAIGMDTYLTFFLPSNTHRDGLAMFIANGCGLAGLIVLLLIRSETRRRNEVHEKPDA